MLMSMRASRRRREDAEDRRYRAERRRKHEAWWATASDEEKAAYTAKEAEEERASTRSFWRVVGLACLWWATVVVGFLWLGSRMVPTDPSQPHHRAHLAP